MKISRRKYKMIDRLKEGSLIDLPIYEKDLSFFDTHKSLFIDTWHEFSESFKSNVFLSSKSFVTASDTAKEKLQPVFIEMVQGGIEYKLKGTFILPAWTVMIDCHFLGDSNDSFFCTMFIFFHSGIPYGFFSNRTDNNKIDNGECGWFSQYYKDHRNLKNIDQKTLEIVFNNVIMDVIIVDMFRSYAQVETKYLPANSRVKDVNCKYINETDMPITHLDSTWFTNLVKSDAFKVRGHFRLQPKKMDGKWTRELIWINEFQKHGYTRKAGILSQKGGAK